MPTHTCPSGTCDITITGCRNQLTGVVASEKNKERKNARERKQKDGKADKGSHNKITEVTKYTGKYKPEFKSAT